jgi:hypothetical protein
MAVLKIKSDQVRVIYNTSDGRIVHVHMTTTIEGGTEPSAEQIGVSASKAAERNKIDLNGTACLDMSRSEWDARKANRVDIRTKTLS